VLRSDPELTSERQIIEHDFERAPDKTLAFVASMPLLYGEEVQPASSYVCPMHAEVTSSEPGTCPKCGMRLVPVHNMIWKLIDRETEAKNHRISWKFTVGERVKIRLINEMDSDHPMHHPFHIHGAGRFLILFRDGQQEANLVWKDTVLLRAGETVDILLYVTNPGLWMAHCHIAEHTESGMMFSFDVAPSSEGK
jgi:FtsP/CotA-like multicopper oxidase with cupredoxin domain